MGGGLEGNLFGAFLNWLYQTGEITVPASFHDRCAKIEEMFDNDVTGVINTILDYSVNSASEAKFKVECSNDTIEGLLNLWLDQININIDNVPTGLQELSREYYKERWEGSSLCLLRVKNWKSITFDGISISVPTTLWFVNGASVFVERPNEANYKIGSDKYYLDEAHKIPISNNANEQIIVQKPFGRWFNKYPTPYTVRKGIYKNFMGISVLQSKSDEVISKVLPYLFTIEKGTAEMFAKGVDYKDEDLKKVISGFKDAMTKYKNEKGKTPTVAKSFDTKYEHLIPDLRNIVSEELFRQGYRAILSALGFVDIIQGLSSTRRESILNPQPFISEVNAGIGGFKSVLMELIKLIIKENKLAHRKLFSANNEIKIVNSPIKINVDSILDVIRSSYDRGAISIESYVETLGFDFTKEKERRTKEAQNGDENLFYPHIINNQEDKGKDTFSPSKPKTPNLEDQNKKKGTPETKTNTAELEINKIAKCSKCGHKFDYLSVQEAGMGWVKCPKCKEAVTQEDLIIAPYDKSKPPAFLKKYPKGAQEVFIDVFNKSLPKGEDYAFPVAWTAMKRWMKKHGYKKIEDKWVKTKENK